MKLSNARAGVLAGAAIGLLAVALPAQAATITLNTTIRDFNDTHVDFENGIGDDRNFVSSTLGGDGKPVYIGGAGTLTTHGAPAFNQWYNDVPGVNLRTTHSITLTQVGVSNVFSFSDGNFFPIDGQLFGNQGRSHNYHFTLELHTAFTYQGGETFTFTGDDDLWVFINGQRIIDLGGVHGAESASVSLDTVAASIGIATGGTYDFDLFFAERHTVASSFRIDTSIALQENPIPEPWALAVFGVGLATLGGLRRRRGR